MGEIYRPKVAILASGGGSTAEAFIHASQEGIIDAEVGLVISNNPPEEAGVYARIDKLNRQYGLDIETMMINQRTHPFGSTKRGQTLGESHAICEALFLGNYDHVALMGYMRIINGALIEEYGWQSGMNVYDARMSNTHPGPLPETEDTYGLGTSERVLKLRLKASKHTVHVVAQGIDKGPKIAEHEVPVIADDTPQTLFDRVQVTEKAMLPIALHNFLREQGIRNGRS